MTGQNLNKKVMVDLQNAGARGIVPLHYANRGPIYDFDILGKVTSLVRKWEGQGKVTRMDEGFSLNTSRYVLTKYANSGQ